MRKRKFHGNQHITINQQQKKPKLLHEAKNILKDEINYTIESDVIEKETKKKWKY